ncbi:polycystin-1-like protein 2 [Branchiostoma floridae x Branchiostoma japonicum]
MLPVGNSTVLDTSAPLFEMDFIDVNSVDVSPKQQLKNMRDQQWKSDRQLRNAGLSLMETMERAADSLLAILPDTEDYVRTFENDDVIVTVARSAKKDGVTLQGGQVNVSASLTHCASDGVTDAKMIVMQRNLFSWNSSTLGKNVTTPVTMFSWGPRHFGHNCTVQINISKPLAFRSTEQPRRQKREVQEHDSDGTKFALGDVAVGQNRSVTMVLHAFDVPTDAVIVVMQLSWWDHSAAFRVFFRYDTPPTEELYDDMKVQVDISGSAIRCNCNVPRPEAVIGGSLHVLPNSIDYDSIFRDPDILNDNNLVFYTVIAEWALYLGRKTDRSATTGNEKQLPQLSVLPPDRMPAPYLYQITVTTGSMLGAGTSARIGFQVFGSKSKTKVKMMNPDGESLLRGGSYDIIMPLKTSLGHLELLNIWHDNTGVDETSWFLKDIIVKDLQTEEVYQFICHDWLSEDRGDFQVQKVLHVATREQLGSFSNLFRENTDGMFYDQHLWTSSLVSPEGSSFTKSERLYCCCAVFNSMMLANAMWYKSDEGFLTKNFVYDLGFVQITLQEDWS